MTAVVRKGRVGGFALGTVDFFLTYVTELCGLKKTTTMYICIRAYQ